MKNCYICHKPLGTGEVLLLLEGFFPEGSDAFKVSGTRGVLCNTCEGALNNEYIEIDGLKIEF